MFRIAFFIAACLLLLSVVQGKDALKQLNQLRSELHLPPLQADARLSEIAEVRLKARIIRSTDVSLRRVPTGVKAEGWGERTGRDSLGIGFLTEYRFDPRFRHAGAAFAVSKGRTHYELLLR